MSPLAWKIRRVQCGFALSLRQLKRLWNLWLPSLHCLIYPQNKQPQRLNTLKEENTWRPKKNTSSTQFLQHTHRTVCSAWNIIPSDAYAVLEKVEDVHLSGERSFSCCWSHWQRPLGSPRWVFRWGIYRVCCNEINLGERCVHVTSTCFYLWIA